VLAAQRLRRSCEREILIFWDPSILQGRNTEPVSQMGRKPEGPQLERFLPWHPDQEVALMDLTLWLPAMFVLGIVGLGLCYAFITACEKI